MPPTLTARVQPEAAAAARFGRPQSILLGLLSALGPIGVDIYLPAFVAIAASLHTDLGTVQMTMAGYFLAMSIGQMVYGPWSDRVGRKPLLILGLAIFLVGSLACAMAGEVWWLIIGRFVQGIGICAVYALVRAVVRDIHHGADAAHLMARILLIVSVSPMLAPMAGSTIAALWSWRMIFWMLAGFALVLMFMTSRMLPETRALADPSIPQPPFLRVLGRLLRDSDFRRCLLLSACANAGAAIYLTSAAPIFLKTYGLPPWAYSLLFAVNALAMIGLAQANRRLILRFGLRHLVWFASGAVMCAVLPLALLSLTGAVPVAALIAAWFVYFGAFGALMGPSSVLALENHKQVAGSASALLGSLQFGGSAAATALAAALFDGSARPALLLQSGLGIVSFASAWLIVRGGQAAPEQRLEA